MARLYQSVWILRIKLSIVGLTVLCQSTTVLQITKSSLVSSVESVQAQGGHTLSGYSSSTLQALIAPSISMMQSSITGNITISRTSSFNVISELENASRTENSYFSTSTRTLDQLPRLTSTLNSLSSAQRTTSASPSDAFNFQTIIFNNLSADSTNLKSDILVSTLSYHSSQNILYSSIMGPFISTTSSSSIFSSAEMSIQSLNFYSLKTYSSNEASSMPNSVNVLPIATPDLVTENRTVTSIAQTQLALQVTQSTPYVTESTRNLSDSVIVLPSTTPDLRSTNETVVTQVTLHTTQSTQYITKRTPNVSKSSSYLKLLMTTVKTADKVSSMLRSQSTSALSHRSNYPEIISVDNIYTQTLHPSSIEPSSISISSVSLLLKSFSESSYYRTYSFTYHLPSPSSLVVENAPELAIRSNSSVSTRRESTLLLNPERSTTHPVISGIDLGSSISVFATGAGQISSVQQTVASVTRVTNTAVSFTSESQVSAGMKISSSYFASKAVPSVSRITSSTVSVRSEFQVPAGMNISSAYFASTDVPSVTRIASSTVLLRSDSQVSANMSTSSLHYVSTERLKASLDLVLPSLSNSFLSVPSTVGSKTNIPKVVSPLPTTVSQRQTAVAFTSVVTTPAVSQFEVVASSDYYLSSVSLSPFVSASSTTLSEMSSSSVSITRMPATFAAPSSVSRISSAEKVATDSSEITLTLQSAAESVTYSTGMSSLYPSMASFTPSKDVLTTDLAMSTVTVDQNLQTGYSRTQSVLISQSDFLFYSTKRPVIFSQSANKKTSILEPSSVFTGLGLSDVSIMTSPGLALVTTEPFSSSLSSVEVSVKPSKQTFSASASLVLGHSMQSLVNFTSQVQLSVTSKITNVSEHPGSSEGTLEQTMSNVPLFTALTKATDMNVRSTYLPTKSYFSLAPYLTPSVQENFIVGSYLTPCWITYYTDATVPFTGIYANVTTIRSESVSTSVSSTNVSFGSSLYVKTGSTIESSVFNLPASVHTPVQSYTSIVQPKVSPMSTFETVRSTPMLFSMESPRVLPTESMPVTRSIMPLSSHTPDSLSVLKAHSSSYVTDLQMYNETSSEQKSSLELPSMSVSTLIPTSETFVQYPTISFEYKPSSRRSTATGSLFQTILSMVRPSTSETATMSSRGLEVSPMLSPVSSNSVFTPLVPFVQSLTSKADNKMSSETTSASLLPSKQTSGYAVIQTLDISQTSLSDNRVSWNANLSTQLAFLSKQGGSTFLPTVAFQSSASLPSQNHSGTTVKDSVTKRQLLVSQSSASFNSFLKDSSSIKLYLQSNETVKATAISSFTIPSQLNVTQTASLSRPVPVDASTATSKLSAGVTHRFISSSSDLSIIKQTLDIKESSSEAIVLPTLAFDSITASSSGPNSVESQLLTPSKVIASTVIISLHESLPTKPSLSETTTVRTASKSIYTLFSKLAVAEVTSSFPKLSANVDLTLSMLHAAVTETIIPSKTYSSMSSQTADAKQSHTFIVPGPSPQISSYQSRTEAPSVVQNQILVSVYSTSVLQGSISINSRLSESRSTETVAGSSYTVLSKFTVTLPILSSPQVSPHNISSAAIELNEIVTNISLSSSLPVNMTDQVSHTKSSQTFFALEPTAQFSSNGTMTRIHFATPSQFMLPISLHSVSSSYEIHSAKHSLLQSTTSRLMTAGKTESPTEATSFLVADITISSKSNTPALISTKVGFSGTVSTAYSNLEQSLQKFSSASPSFISPQSSSAFQMLYSSISTKSNFIDSATLSSTLQNLNSSFVSTKSDISSSTTVVTGGFPPLGNLRKRRAIGDSNFTSNGNTSELRLSSSIIFSRAISWVMLTDVASTNEISATSISSVSITGRIRSSLSDTTVNITSYSTFHSSNVSSNTAKAMTLSDAVKSSVISTPSLAGQIFPSHTIINSPPSLPSFLKQTETGLAISQLESGHVSTLLFQSEVHLTVTLRDAVKTSAITTNSPADQIFSSHSITSSSAEFSTHSASLAAASSVSSSLKQTQTALAATVLESAFTSTLVSQANVHLSVESSQKIQATVRSDLSIVISISSDIIKDTVIPQSSAISQVNSFSHVVNGSSEALQGSLTLSTGQYEASIYSKAVVNSSNTTSSTNTVHAERTILDDQSAVKTVISTSSAVPEMQLFSTLKTAVPSLTNTLTAMPSPETTVYLSTLQRNTSFTSLLSQSLTSLGGFSTRKGLSIAQSQSITSMCEKTQKVSSLTGNTTLTLSMKQTVLLSAIGSTASKSGIPDGTEVPSSMTPSMTSPQTILSKTAESKNISRSTSVHPLSTLQPSSVYFSSELHNVNMTLSLSTESVTHKTTLQVLQSVTDLTVSPKELQASQGPSAADSLYRSLASMSQAFSLPLRVTGLHRTVSGYSSARNITVFTSLISGSATSELFSDTAISPFSSRAGATLLKAHQSLTASEMTLKPLITVSSGTNLSPETVIPTITDVVASFVSTTYSSKITGIESGSLIHSVSSFPTVQQSYKDTSANVIFSNVSPPLTPNAHLTSLSKMNATVSHSQEVLSSQLSSSMDAVAATVGQSLPIHSSTSPSDIAGLSAAASSSASPSKVLTTPVLSNASYLDTTISSSSLVQPLGIYSITSRNVLNMSSKIFSSMSFSKVMSTPLFSNFLISSEIILSISSLASRYIVIQTLSRNTLSLGSEISRQYSITPSKSSDYVLSTATAEHAAKSVYSSSTSSAAVTLEHHLTTTMSVASEALTTAKHQVSMTLSLASYFPVTLSSKPPSRMPTSSLGMCLVYYTTKVYPQPESLTSVSVVQHPSISISSSMQPVDINATISTSLPAKLNNVSFSPSLFNMSTATTIHLSAINTSVPGNSSSTVFTTNVSASSSTLTSSFYLSELSIVNFTLSVSGSLSTIEHSLISTRVTGISENATQRTQMTLLPSPSVSSILVAANQTTARSSTVPFFSDVSEISQSASTSILVSMNQTTATPVIVPPFSNVSATVRSSSTFFIQTSVNQTVVKATPIPLFSTVSLLSPRPSIPSSPVIVNHTTSKSSMFPSFSSVSTEKVTQNISLPPAGLVSSSLGVLPVATTTSTSVSSFYSRQPSLTQNLSVAGVFSSAKTEMLSSFSTAELSAVVSLQSTPTMTKEVTVTATSVAPTTPKAVRSDTETGVKTSLSVHSVGVSSGTIVLSSPSSLLSAVTSSAVISTASPVTEIPLELALVQIDLKENVNTDVNTKAYIQNLETKLAETYNRFKSKRRRRAVTVGGTTANVTKVTRQGNSENVVAEFYIEENNRTVPAQQSASVFNNLSPQGLSRQLGITVTSPVSVVNSVITTSVTTVSIVNSVSTSSIPPTPAPTSTPQIISDNFKLGMVLRDSASNNISVGNNRQIFATTMASSYKAGTGVTGTVILNVSYIIHEPNNIVYLEFYVTVDNVLQNGSTVASFYKTQTTGALSASLSTLGYTVEVVPYALTGVQAAELNYVKITVKPPLASNADVTSAQFKRDMSVKLTALYKEGRDQKTANRKRRATESVTTTIVSSVALGNGQGRLIFYILDKGQVLTGSTAASILNKVSQNRMATTLGVEVIILPAAVAVLPGPTTTTDSKLWIIGAVLGPLALALIVLLCIYWRWKVGGPKGKITVTTPEEIKMAEKQRPTSYGDIARYVQGENKGGPTVKTTSLSAPADVSDEEKPRYERRTSTRRKVQPQQLVPRPHAGNIGRQNAAYESDDDEIEEEEDEDDEEEEEHARQPPAGRNASRPTSAIRTIEVQPGPTRPGSSKSRQAQHVQRSEVPRSRSTLDGETDEESEKEIVPPRPKQPIAGELPPIVQMKGMKEPPSYPPVRFRTNVEPSPTSPTGALPPISKSGASLIAQRSLEIDSDLLQKADAERVRNKQRQRQKHMGKSEAKVRQKIDLEKKSDMKAWEKAQQQFGSVLDPLASQPQQRRHSNARKRRRLRRKHKVDVAGVTEESSKENDHGRRKNYITLMDSKGLNTETKTDEVDSDQESELSINEARKRMHSLLEDAFALLEPFQKNAEKKDPSVMEEKIPEGKEAPSVAQMPTAPQLMPPRYAGMRPALPEPAPSHGRATAPPPSHRRRVPPHTMGMSPYGDYQMPPVITKDPVVVMDPTDRRRYLYQRLGQPVYGRTPSTFSCPNASPDGQNVFITPVQQQPDGMGGIIWSPYSAKDPMNEIQETQVRMFNTMPYPQPGYLSRLQQTPPTSSSTYAPRPPPRYTTIDMKDTGYPSKQDTPQPLIRAIKDELLRLSQNAQGKTRIQELPNT